MTPAELHILQHSLGLDQYGQGNSYRNHFCTGVGGSDHALCMSLVEMGFMTRRASVKMYGGDDVFFVTEDGHRACVAESPKPPKLTRGQQRYRNFLADDSSLSFIEYLRAFHGRRRAA